MLDAGCGGRGQVHDVGPGKALANHVQNVLNQVVHGNDIERNVWLRGEAHWPGPILDGACQAIHLTDEAVQPGAAATGQLTFGRADDDGRAEDSERNAGYAAPARDVTCSRRARATYSASRRGRERQRSTLVSEAPLASAAAARSARSTRQARGPSVK